MPSQDLDLLKPNFQGPLRSKIIRTSLTDIQNNFNSLRSEVQNTLSSTASEVTSARDGFGALQDNIHIRRVMVDGIATGGVVTAQGTPDNTVRVTAGQGIVNGVGVSFTAGTSGTIAAVTATRKNVVVINSDNSTGIELGATGTDALPTLAATQRPLAIISQSTASPAVFNSADIVDARNQGAFITNRKIYKFLIQDAVDYLDDDIGGYIDISPGAYYEQVDLTGKNNVTLNFQEGAKLYRRDSASYAIKSINTAGSITENIKITGGQFFGNSMTGSQEILKFDYTDKFVVQDSRLNGNSGSSATYENFRISNSDNWTMRDIETLTVNGTASDLTYFWGTCTNYNFTNFSRIIVNSEDQFDTLRIFIDGQV